jgi:hypothetical protein
MSLFWIKIIKTCKPADVCVRLTYLTGKLRANVRAALFKVVEGIDGSAPPLISNANLLINELIREYLDYNGYRYETSPPSCFDLAIAVCNFFLQAIEQLHEATCSTFASHCFI